MKKTLFELFFEKILNVPLWIKQIMYLKLFNEMQDNFCEEFLRNNTNDLFSLYIPTLTFKGKTELSERKCGLDSNIYNFLKCCEEGQSLIEISVNRFLSLEEVAKYFELCIEQNFIKLPESVEIKAMSGFISGKLRTGEYFKHKGVIDVDQLQAAILANRDAMNSATPKRFGEILIELGYITIEDLKAVLILKDEAKKRFILDYNNIPKSESAPVSDSQKYQEEIESLKNENSKLKKRLIQLLELVKRDAK